MKLTHNLTVNPDDAALWKSQKASELPHLLNTIWLLYVIFEVGNRLTKKGHLCFIIDSWAPLVNTSDFILVPFDELEMCLCSI